MEIKNLTCTECPKGCRIEVKLDGGKITSITGNSCPRGKMYAENEVIAPKRVVTSTVRTLQGKMISVKTDKPVLKENIFNVIKIIDSLHPSLPLNIGDVIYKDISDGADLVATSNEK